MLLGLGQPALAPEEHLKHVKDSFCLYCGTLCDFLQNYSVRPTREEAIISSKFTLALFESPIQL